MESKPSSSSLHIAMYPWLAFGHITPFLHISNKLAQRGHKISFLIPTKTQQKLQHLNLFPNLITFVPVTVPHVDGLPPDAETTSDVPKPLFPLIMTAMDRTQPAVELLLRGGGLKPDIFLYDCAHWIPNLGQSLGFKTVYLCVISPVLVAYIHRLDPQETPSSPPAEHRLLRPPPGFPDQTIKLHRHELPYFVQFESEAFGEGITMRERIRISTTRCDAYASRGSREIEGPFFEFMEKSMGLKFVIVGPIVPELPVDSSACLDPEWDGFLSRFEPNSVIYCGFGSEQTQRKDQFQELVLGLELSGHPFLAALKPPSGAQTVEEAFPEGFAARVKGRGIVFGGWIQQQMVLQHPAVGCYVTHCGSGSLMEGLVSKGCQLVMVPFGSDQIFNARLIGNRLRAGVEVERGEEDGLFTRDGVCRAIRTVMDQDENGNGNGSEIRANRAKLRELFLKEGFESSYVDAFSQSLQDLVGRGIVFGGWIQQQMVLQHPAVGCYVTHCGSGSLMEGLVSKGCQLVMVPFESDQIFNTKLIGNRLRAGVEVERGEEDGLFTRDGVCRAIRTVMDEDENGNGNGSEIRANRAKLRELFLKEGFESSYVDAFSQSLQDLVGK